MRKEFVREPEDGQGLERHPPSTAGHALPLNPFPLGPFVGAQHALSSLPSRYLPGVNSAHMIQIPTLEQAGSWLALTSAMASP